MRRQEYSCDISLKSSLFNIKKKQMAAAAILRAKHLPLWARIPTRDFQANNLQFFRVNSLGFHAFNTHTKHYETYPTLHHDIHPDHLAPDHVKEQIYMHLSRHHFDLPFPKQDAMIEWWTSCDASQARGILSRPLKFIMNGVELARISRVLPGRHLIYRDIIPGNAYYFIPPPDSIQTDSFQDCAPGGFNPEKKYFGSGTADEKFIEGGKCTRFFYFPNQSKLLFDQVTFSSVENPYVF